MKSRMPLHIPGDTFQGQSPSPGWRWSDQAISRGPVAFTFSSYIASIPVIRYPLCLELPLTPRRATQLSAVPGSEAARHASSLAARGLRGRKCKRKRADVQMRERKLQSDAEGRFKPWQRCSGRCCGSWSCLSPMCGSSPLTWIKAGSRSQTNPLLSCPA